MPAGAAKTLFVNHNFIFCTFSFIPSKFTNADYGISQDHQKTEIPGSLIRKTTLEITDEEILKKFKELQKEYQIVKPTCEACGDFVLRRKRRKRKDALKSKDSKPKKQARKSPWEK